MLRKSKSISQIYEETKHYDLVITNDAALATALNKLVDNPRLDYFAMTPRQIASKFALLNFTRLYSKAEIILEITKLTKNPLKLVHQSIEKIFDVWNHTGLLESCNLFLGDEKNLLKYLEKLTTVEYAMEKFDESFYENKTIATAGLILFNELDKQVLPKKGKAADEIDLFDSEENIIEKTYIFSASNDIVNQTIDLITPENANETAIVLNTESKYPEVFKSRLVSKGIKLQIKIYLREDLTTGSILSFMESAMSLNELKLSEALFLEAFLDIKLNRKFSRYHFSNYVKLNKHQASLQRAYEIMSETITYSFGKLIEVLGKSFQIKPREEFLQVIELLELKDKMISEENVNLLKYFITNIDIELERSEDGVLLVNSLNSAYVDRQLVFFIGMDESWCRLNPDKPYIEKDTEEEKNLTKFQILLSQGMQKYYMALDSKSSSGFIPCYYFNILADRNIDSFENNFFKPVNAGYERPDSVVQFRKDKTAKAEIDEIKIISQSDLNNFFKCPKKYAYSKLISSEENVHLAKGILLHSFAEFYFQYPEEAVENFERIRDELLVRYKVFFKDESMAAEKTEFAVSMKAIMRFIDSKLLVKEKAEEKIENSGNFLFELFGKEKIYSNTERKFENHDAGIKGKIDLISSKTIVDYKTGKQSKTDPMMIKEFQPELLKESNIKDVNFQTPAYLAGQRDIFKNEEIEFLYLQLLESREKILKGNESGIEYSYLKYIPKTFKEYVSSEEFFNRNTTKLFKRTGYENYKRFIESNLDSVNFFDNGECREFEEKFYTYVTETLGISIGELDRRSVDQFKLKEVQPSLKAIKLARTKGSIFSDDIDNFIKLAKEKIALINKYNKEDFPNEPAMDLRNICKSCEYLNICIGNKFWTGVENEEYN